MVISFLYVPLLLHALETDAYAIWLTLTSIVSWIVMFDVGIGNGLRNRLSETLARQEIKEAQSFVSTAYISILIIGIIICAFFIFSVRLINWASVLNATLLPLKTINILVIVVGMGFIAHFLLGLINSILLSLKLPALSSLIGCLGQLLSYLVVLWFVKIIHNYDLILLCSIISFVPAIVLLVATFAVFNGRYSYLKPKITYFDKSKLQDIFSVGLNFFWLQIITIILFQLNNFIITHTVGPTAVVQYNICYKYLYTLVTIYTLICTPFWSASTHEYTSGNLKWISDVNLKLIKIGGILVLVGIAMVLLAPVIYQIWLKNDYPEIPSSTNVLMLLYCVFMIFYSANGYIINGIGKLRLQTIITTMLALVYLPMAIYGGKLYGLNGVLVALIFNATINSIWSYIQLRKLVNNTASGIWIK